MGEPAAAVLVAKVQAEAASASSHSALLPPAVLPRHRSGLQPRCVPTHHLLFLLGGETKKKNWATPAQRLCVSCEGSCVSVLASSVERTTGRMYMASYAPVTDSEALEALSATGEAIDLRLRRKQAGLPSCERMRVGRGHGGSTYGVHVLCHAEYEAGACTVVSYGVERNYWFELELANRTGCRVVACDPTVRHPPRLGPNVFFKPWAAPASTPRLMCGPGASPRMRPNCSLAALLPEPRIGAGWRTVGPSFLTRLATAERFAELSRELAEICTSRDLAAIWLQYVRDL